MTDETKPTKEEVEKAARELTKTFSDLRSDVMSVMVGLTLLTEVVNNLNDRILALEAAQGGPVEMVH